jgi:hypothetical protein
VDNKIVQKTFCDLCGKQVVSSLEKMRLDGFSEKFTLYLSWTVKAVVEEGESPDICERCHAHLFRYVYDTISANTYQKEERKKYDEVEGIQIHREPTPWGNTDKEYNNNEPT